MFDEVKKSNRSRDLSWQDKALCAEIADDNLFFPERGADTQAAKQVCVNCDVIEACLNYAIEEEIDFGTWGGKTNRERRKIVRAKKRAEARAELAKLYNLDNEND